MRELLLLAGARAKAVRYSVRQFLRSSRLRIVVVAGLVAFFWLLMFAAFLDVFLFLRDNFQAITDVLLDYLFAFLFLSLLVMMTISDAIIAYTSLFRSEETEFLFSLPLRAQNTFAYRTADSIVFSLWGIGALVLPMVLSYALVFPTTWYFLPASLVLAFLFILFATTFGGLFALLTALVLPRRRKKWLLLLGVLAAAIIAWAVLPWRERLRTGLFSETTVSFIMERIAFCQHWALPSQWVAGGMLAAARGAFGEAAFLTALLLSNVAFFAWAARRTARHAYRRTWERAQSTSTRRPIGRSGLRARLLRGTVFFLPFRLRQLVLKDLKTFLRDPSQWSQFLLFFGLLGLYVLNLPRFRLAQLEPYWHSLISLLNLGATCLTLATLTTRFVFPQLSLEGRRIWLLGLLPVRRTLILWSKFLFTTVGTFLISGGLIALSDLMLDLPLWVLGAHLLVVLCVCCGLNGLAVGLGAVYPQLGTDNPSKIVSSFGGTLNLICSICFVAAAIAPVVVPLHLHMMGRWETSAMLLWLGIGLGVVLLVSLAASLIPMLAGARAFSRMEF